MENNDILPIETEITLEEGIDFFENAKDFFIKNFNFAYNNDRKYDESSLEFNERIREEATELDEEREKIYNAMISLFDELDNITQKKVTQEAGIDLSDIPNITLFKEDEIYSNKHYINNEHSEDTEENQQNNSDMFL